MRSHVLLIAAGIRQDGLNNFGKGMAERSHILIVEDDPLVAEVVMEALDEVYDTTRAETSAAAMEHLRSGGVDAVLLDCTLPGGLDPRLLPMADDRGVPVILMSGDPELMERVPGAQRRCIEKPFSLTVLLATIEAVLPASAPPADGAARTPVHA